MEREDEGANAPAADAYEAPRVESITTADDLEREALFGGFSDPP